MTPYDIHPCSEDQFCEIILYYAAFDEDTPDKPLADAVGTTFQRHLKLIPEAPELFRFRRPPT